MWRSCSGSRRSFVRGGEHRTQTEPRPVLRRDDHDWAAIYGVEHLEARYLLDALLFPGPPQVPVGTNSISVAVADLNADTKPDLVTANAGSSAVSVLLQRTPDSTPPVVSGSDFHYLTAPHRLTFMFSEDVGPSLSAVDLEITNLTTGTVVPPASIAVSYNLATNTATFTVPGVPGGILADGNYRARLIATGVTDASGNPLENDVLFSFFHLTADANHDRSVNLGDFAALAANFNRPGDVSQGDFNYTGAVDLSDFSVLARWIGSALPALGRRYTVQEIRPPSTPSPNPSMTGTAINNNGQVVGVFDYWSIRPQQSGFYWSSGSLTWVPAEMPRPSEITDSGLVVGVSYGFASGNTRPFTWRIGDAAPTYLPSPIGVAEPARLDGALGANQSGLVVGFAGSQFPPVSGPIPATWQASSAIGRSGGARFTAVNSSGTAVGTNWAHGSFSGVALDINDAGDVVGALGEHSFTAWGGPGFKGITTNGLPFRYSAASGVASTLPLLPGFDRGQPQAINESGQVVGGIRPASATSIRSWEAVLWEEENPIVLDQLLVDGNNVRLYIANDINDHGQIIAYGESDTQPADPDTFATFVLTPVEVVTLGDFSAPAANFNRLGDFSQGDFNYYGTVELSDSSLLATKFKSSLRPALARGPRTAGELPSYAAVRLPATPMRVLFSNDRIERAMVAELLS